jgi:glycosyltransferase involved in cell wall biosynthesis
MNHAQMEKLNRTVEGLRGLVTAVYEGAAGWPERLAEIRRTDEWHSAYAELEPLVTVRIATWNRAQMLVDRALASALRQTYSRLEILVVGDACTDDTAERIAALEDERIRFHNLPVRGPYPDDGYQRWLVAGIPAMNAGALMARGTWIAPLDDDDEWDDDHLEVLVGAALESRAELAYGRLRGRLHDPPMSAVIGTWPPRMGEFAFQGAIYNAALRGFQYDQACRYLSEPGDWNLARRMWEAGVRFHFVDRPVGTWHQEQGSAELIRWFAEHAPDG